MTFSTTCQAEQMLNRLLDFFSSLRLALVLLLGLALVAVFGTIWPSRDTHLDVFRYELFYQTPWFRLLLGLLAFNLIVCTLRLLMRRLRDRQRLGEQLRKGTDSGYRLPLEADAGTLLDLLKRQGYRGGLVDGRILAWRRRIGRYGVLIIHGSLLAIMGGALLSGAGFVGTLNIYVGDSSSTVFDWDAGTDRPLGFNFRLDRFEPLFYPIDLRFAAMDAAGQKTLREYTTREGERVDLPRAGWQADVVHFDPFVKRLDLRILNRGEVVADYRATAGVRDPDNQVGGMIFYPLAYRDPVLKQLHSEVSILEGGKVVRRGAIEVNRPLVHRGITIYQTAFDRDPSGRFYGGFQFSRDPGEPLVWAGCIVLMLGLFINMLLRPRAVGLIRDADAWRLVGLLGFRGEAGREALQQLAEKLRSARS
ncbi:hypothetical protein C2E25_01970 [Geothermobacter hydrogeniphilus]|uniref:ResB-like domain-containing protein n=1 Tax=Geothermobacter hydrogeniphilus TaxID=1969733 RepID=A0A2K2HDH2_9BACT|nr:cytochrome c biogenesis protein ResB [Geothermobacter hydrogeniphilus]PNU21345.1 hypothetical protein C2E25_01970 [Geothermobacter hydrogeniphilus]